MIESRRCDAADLIPSRQRSLPAPPCGRVWEGGGGRGRKYEYDPGGAATNCCCLKGFPMYLLQIPLLHQTHTRYATKNKKTNESILLCRLRRPVVNRTGWLLIICSCCCRMEHRPNALGHRATVDMIVWS